MEFEMKLKAVMLAIAVSVGIASYYVGFFKGKPDNPVEQIAEEVIKEETGLTIDLSPDSETKSE